VGRVFLFIRPNCIFKCNYEALLQRCSQSYPNSSNQVLQVCGSHECFYLLFFLNVAYAAQLQRCSQSYSNCCLRQVSSLTESIDHRWRGGSESIHPINSLKPTSSIEVMRSIFNFTPSHLHYSAYRPMNQQSIRHFICKPFWPTSVYKDTNVTEIYAWRYKDMKEIIQ